MAAEIFQVATAALTGVVVSGAGAWLVFGVNKVTRSEFREQMEEKASKEVMDTQYETILRELEDIKSWLVRIGGEQ